MAEDRVLKLGNIYGFRGGSYDGNVFSEEYLSPTLRSCMNHGSVPEIVEVVKITEWQKTK